MHGRIEIRHLAQSLLGGAGLVALHFFALALDAPKGMQPRVLIGDSSHCDAVMVRNGHLSIEEVCLTSTDGRKKSAEVAWDGHLVAIKADEKASADWIRSRSLLSRLTTQHHDLYWDGKKGELGEGRCFRLVRSHSVARWCPNLRADDSAQGFLGVLAV